jgi:hypothetical protein
MDSVWALRLMKQRRCNRVATSSKEYGQDRRALSVQCGEHNEVNLNINRKTDIPSLRLAQDDRSEK